MSIKVGQAFERTSANPIDESMTLTKAQMLTVNDNLMPAYYFTICQDDGKIYLYDKTATASLTTGKFTEFSGGGSGDVKIFTTTATLSDEINGTTTVAAADLPGVTWTDLKAGASIVKDAKGTLGLVTAITGTTSVTVTTATTSTPTRELTQAQYDALSVADKNNGTIYFVTDANPLAGARQTQYSTTEQAIGTWIDGKTIYQKTMIVENPTNDWNTNPYAGGASISNMDVKVHSHIIMEWHNSASDTTPRFTELPLVYGNSSTYAIIENISALPGDSSCRFQWIGQNTRIVDRLWCTLQYTKTTD